MSFLQRLFGHIEEPENMVIEAQDENLASMEQGNIKITNKTHR